MNLNKDALYTEYIINNKSRKECSSIFNCAESTIAKYLHLYNIKKDRKKIIENTAKTLLDKYGVTNASYLETNTFKKNNPSQNQDTLNKRIATYKKNYRENSNIKAKRQQTNIKRFGAKTFAESKYFADIMRCKAQQRDNFDILWNKDKLLQSILEFDNKPTIYELANKLSYSYSVVGKHIREFNLLDYIDSKRSQPNLYWHDLILRELGIDLKFEGKIFGNRQSCDLYSDEKKIGIDINPTASHNTQFNVYTRQYAHTISTTYHRNRAISAEENGWLLYQIFDWDDQEKVIHQLKSLFGQNTRIPARKCSVREIDAHMCDMFLETYHMQGKIGAKYRYGLFYQDELVSVMTFGNARFSKLAPIELLRYCSKETVIGGASKLFCYAIKQMNCDSIITYSDMAKGSGNLYSILGFDFVGYADLNAYYAPINPTGQALKTQAASLEYKKYGQQYHSCKEYFNAKSWYRINDAGSKIWLWKK